MPKSIKAGSLRPKGYEIISKNRNNPRKKNYYPVITSFPIDTSLYFSEADNLNTVSRTNEISFPADRSL